MIDLHCHILPGLDDGPGSMEEALEMCRLSYQDGVRTIVATPHILNGVYSNPPEKILEGVRAINSLLTTPSHEESSLRITILPGADVHFTEGLLRDLEEGRILTVADGGRFIFIEFPFQGIPFNAEEILFRLLSHGITPIITHPERNLDISKNPKRYYEMIRMGCLGQVTAMSLTGEFGREVREMAERLLKSRWIHFIASDAHSPHRRPPLLSRGLKRAEKILGREEAFRMVTEYPQAILEGKRPEVAEPLPWKQ